MHCFNITMTFRMIWVNLEQTSAESHGFLGINICRRKKKNLFTKAALRSASDDSYQGKIPNSYTFCRFMRE